ncbi:hypothetical protein [Kitasatospora sp. NPDC008115]|uniref:hypothetical protein n=1 Tax=Kitasatospora sp. NPDC008115 TaxID=3364022 RepID=UPI0036EE14D2
MSETLVPAEAAPVTGLPAPARPSAPARPVSPPAPSTTAPLPAVEQVPTAALAVRRSPSRPGHTRGGLPVVPLAVAGGNTAVGAVSAAALAGGPMMLALLAGGAAAATGAAVLRSRTRKPPTGPDAEQASNRPSAGHQAGAGGLFGSPGPTGGRSTPGHPHRPGPAGASRTAARNGTAAGSNAPVGAGSASRRAAGAASHVHPGGAPGRPGRGAAGTTGAVSGPGSRAAGHRLPGGGGGSGLRVRAAQVRAARAERAASAPSLREKRVQDTAARRTVADARRAAKTTAREQKRAAKTVARELSRSGLTAPGAAAAGVGGAGGVGSVAGSAREVARQARRQARQDKRLTRHQDRESKRQAGRVARDGRADQRVRERRVAMRKGAVARAARKRLRRSAGRYWARWALAALLAGAVGLIGAVTTPLGRRLGAPWLMYPGRRLFARMLGRARDDRQVRDGVIAAALDADLAAAETLDTPEDDTDEGVVADTVPRAPRNHHSNDSTESPGGIVSTATSTFSFAQVAAEMEALANTFDPDGMMEVLAMCEEIPDALQSIANVFKILAEKADDEFPLEAPIAEALTEVYSHIQLAVQAAGEVGPVFRTHHEHDIRRHEDPRTGEQKWDTNNN